jgi:hypothetical protein
MADDGCDPTESSTEAEEIDYEVKHPTMEGDR